VRIRPTAKSALLLGGTSKNNWDGWNEKKESVAAFSKCGKVKDKCANAGPSVLSVPGIHIVRMGLENLRNARREDKTTNETQSNQGKGLLLR